MRWRLIATTVIGTGLSAALVGAGAFAVATLLTPTVATVSVPRETFLADAPQAPLMDPRAPLPAEPPPDSDAAPPPTAEPATQPPPAPDRPARRLADAPARSAVGSPEEAPPLSRPPRRTPAPAPTAAEAPPAAPRIRPAPDRPAEPGPRVAALSPPAAAPAPPRAPGPNILSPGEVRRMRLALRLTPDQELHWPAVEAALLQIGAQQAALARQGQDVAGALTSEATMRVYWAARPLLETLREDQKAQIRLRARMMGFGSVASYL